ncbi:hypothetical protein GCM10010124_29090 [Pilimelia terevasa]|uniref:Sensor-like histidine kinase SenX3 n=1 Tax=Pilimelia terevasa TaxID=53372 RepID=A0A8J3BN88_9ACTN|nr:ATP-binding protein [Pilimelia terevasa]GGK34599.1 hypothetical protein GCM10010124_29090 [Pilimelia terevasa]
MDEAGETLDFRALFEAAPVPLIILDPDLAIIAANDAYLAVTRTDRAAIVGRPVFDIFPDAADSHPGGGALRRSLERVVREHAPDTMPIHRYDLARPGADGGLETRYWAPVSVPVCTTGGRLRWIVHRVEDVTAYVRARDAGDEPPAGADETRREQAAAGVFGHQRLREEKQTLQALVDNLDTAVVGCDAQGRPVLHNDAGRGLYGTLLDGVPAAEWPGRLGLRHPDGSAVAPAEFALTRALAGERVRDAEMVVRPPTGAQRIFRVHARPVTGPTGLAAVVAAHEVTEHRRVARLVECELELAKVLNAPGPADDVVARMIELIGTRLDWAAVEFWTVDDVAQVLRRGGCWAAPGRDLPCRLPEPLLYGQGLAGRAWQAAAPAWAGDLAHDPAGEGGEWGPLRAALAVPIPSGPVILAVLVCYSDTVETPDEARTAVLTGIGAHIGEFMERRRAERLVAELDRTRDEYIALVGHELRTPLTSIQSYTDLLRAEPDLPAAQRAELLAVMHRNTVHLHGIVAKLLDVAGMRSGHIGMHPRPMDLTAVVDGALAAARDSAGTTVAVELNAPGEVRIDGDPDRLREVAAELLHNALTWAAEDSAVAVNLHADDRTATLSVANTGIRIPSAEHERIFELFFRTDAARHRGIPGSGLGLTLARAVVEQHGGTIAVSEPDEAVTTFTVRLPTRHPAPRHPVGA